MPALIRRLYSVVEALEAEYGLKFTPDGHLVGSIGGVIGATHYWLRLLSHPHEGHDAVTTGGKHVKIKATQGASVALRSKPNHLVVLQLTRRGGHDIICGGPGSPPWAVCGTRGTNGQRRIGLTRLASLMKAIDKCDQLSAV